MELYLKSLVQAIRKKPRVEVDIDLNFIMELYEKQEGLCSMSDIKMTCNPAPDDIYNVSIERLDLSKGYTKDNVELCIRAMHKARAKFPREFVIQGAISVYKHRLNQVQVS